MIFLVYFLSGLLFFLNSDIQTWKLIWSDDFSKDGIPSSQYWNFRKGFADPEKNLYYTPSNLNHARVINGHLFIEARNNIRDKQNIYSSAYIHTKQKVKFQYGRLEIKAKLPNSNAIPSFCLISDRDSLGVGELRITTENSTHEIKGVISNNHNEQIKRSAPVTPSPVNHHVFAIEWDPHEISFFVDEVLYLRYTKNNSRSWLFDHPLYLTIDLGVDKSSASDKTADRHQLVIDYVRYFKKNVHKKGYEIPIVIK